MAWKDRFGNYLRRVCVVIKDGHIEEDPDVDRNAEGETPVQVRAMDLEMKIGKFLKWWNN